MNNLDVFEKQLQQYIHLGFSDFKIKVSGKLEQDKQNLELITNLVKNVRIRLDANNLWTDVEEAIDYLKKLEKVDYDIFDDKLMEHDNMTILAQLGKTWLTGKF